MKETIVQLHLSGIQTILKHNCFDAINDKTNQEISIQMMKHAYLKRKRYRTDVIPRGSLLCRTE